MQRNPIRRAICNIIIIILCAVHESTLLLLLCHDKGVGRAQEHIIIHYTAAHRRASRSSCIISTFDQSNFYCDQRDKLCIYNGRMMSSWCILRCNSRRRRIKTIYFDLWLFGCCLLYNDIILYTIVLDIRYLTAIKYRDRMTLFIKYTYIYYSMYVRAAVFIL